MATVRELREQRARLITQARAKHSEIVADTTEARAAEIETEFNAMIAQAEGLERQATSLEALERAEASLESGDPRRPDGNEGRAAADPAPEGVTYRQAFYELMGAGGDTHAMRLEARAALAAGPEGSTPEQRAQTVGTAGAGGNIVPDEMMAPIVRAMAAWGPMYDDGFATVINTTGGGSLPIPGLDDTAKTAEDNTSEGVALTDDGGKDAVFTKQTLGDYMIDTEWLRVSVQLATSGLVNMENLLGDLLGERLGRKANASLTIGSGSGEALGIVTGAAASGVTIASNAAITADELLKVFHSVDPAYRASPKFGMMFNDATLLALHQLKDGQGNYLIKAAPDGSGRIQIGAVSVKYKINQAMAGIGANARSVVIGDMGKYFVRKIGNVVVGSDRGARFFPGFGVAGFARFDGAVADLRAIKALVHPA